MQEQGTPATPEPFRLTRRDLAAALVSFSAACGTAASGRQDSAVWGHDSIYTRLFGIRPFLSCQGHNTVIGGSRMPPEVLRAIEEANDYFVDMHELNRAAGQRIAEVMQAEAALVSAGAFSGLLLGAAACLTGTDPERIEALPHPTWEKRECLIQTHHRFNYDRAYRAAGMTIVEAETKEELIGKISDKTAMIAVLARVERMQDPPPGTMMPQEFVEIGKEAAVPVLIDAASELPPPDILTRHITMGADLVVISGGKGLRGPQSAGILAGRKDLIEAATLNHSPNRSIGRGMKVGKEEIVGLVAAVNRYASLDHDAVIEGWNKKARYIAAQLNEVPGIQAECKDNTQGFDNVHWSWDPSVIPLTGSEAAKELRAGEPRILINGGSEAQAGLTTQCMRDGDEIFAARGLRGFFLERSRAT